MAHGSTRLDVLHYSAKLEPEIAGKSVKGTVRIRFATDSQEVEFNCGDLTIDFECPCRPIGEPERSRSSFTAHHDAALASFLTGNRSTPLRDGAAPIREAIYRTFNDNVGILSLSEIPDHELMWSHYADTHRGLVLCFDERHSFFNRRRSENDGDDLFLLGALF